MKYNPSFLPPAEHELLAFHGSILDLVQEPDRRQGAVLFHDVDFLHVRGIADTELLLRVSAVHLVFHVVDDDDAVGRDTPVGLKEEGPVKILVRKPADLFRFGKEPLLGSLSPEG